jgi:aryl-alcohol dehydrogenase-like predicted oxidoreductase
MNCNWELQYKIQRIANSQSAIIYGNSQLTIWQCFQHVGSASRPLELTPIGLGAWAIGGEWRFGWGIRTYAESIRDDLSARWRSGLNWIDTAAIYGLGHSEEVVGRALQDIPRSERPYVFTKCSLVWDEAARLRTACAASRFDGRSSRA